MSVDEPRSIFQRVKRVGLSLAQAIPAALVGFLLGGVGGLYLQEYFSRAKPEIFPISVSFGGLSEELVETSENTVRAARGVAWFKPLSRYESFRTLDTQEETSAVQSERLRTLIKLLQQWKEAASRSPSRLLSRGVVLDHPCLGSHIDLCGQILQPLTLGDRLKPPLPLGAVKASLPVIPMQVVKTENLPGQDVFLSEMVPKAPLAFVISEGRPRVFQDVWPFYTSKQLAAVELFAESFSRGTAPNVLYYTEQLLNQAHADLEGFAAIRSALQQELLPKAHLTVEVQIYNGGKKPISFRPYFGLKLIHEQKGTSFILATQGSRSEFQETLAQTFEAYPEPIRSLLAQRAGGETKPESFLPRSSETPYLTVGPDSTLTTKLISTEPLGEKGKMIAEYYRTGLLSCQLVGITTEGKAVWSSEVEFGQAISERHRDWLKATLRDK